jgi:hypothetical protein
MKKKVTKSNIKVTLCPNDRDLLHKIHVSTRILLVIASSLFGLYLSTFL